MYSPQAVKAHKDRLIQVLSLEKNAIKANVTAQKEQMTSKSNKPPKPQKEFKDHQEGKPNPRATVESFYSVWPVGVEHLSGLLRVEIPAWTATIGKGIEVRS